MEEEEDFVLALQLQELWEAEDKEAAAAAAAAAAPCPEALRDLSPLRPLSVVDEAWELLDPSPDVHGLFVQFNEALFWGRLAAVEVSWSPRMTLYAVGVGGAGAARRAALHGEAAAGFGSGAVVSGLPLGRPGSGGVREQGKLPWGPSRVPVLCQRCCLVLSFTGHPWQP